MKAVDFLIGGTLLLGIVAVVVPQASCLPVTMIGLLLAFAYSSKKQDDAMDADIDAAQTEAEHTSRKIGWFVSGLVFTIAWVFVILTVLAMFLQVQL